MYIDKGADIIHFYRNFTLFIIFIIIAIQGHALEYRVKKSDTLWSISKKFNVPCDVISSINFSRAGKIMQGQVLTIPDRMIRYVVRKGDNLSKITRDYGVKSEIVKKINKLYDGNLNEGQVLSLPIIKNNMNNPLQAKPLQNKSREYSEYFITRRPNFRTNEIISKDSNKIKDKKFLPPADLGEVKQVRNKGRGVIVFLNKDTKIKSIQKGIVRFSGRMNGYNNVIIIDYGDDLFAVYGYLGERKVGEGEAVSEEQEIGSAGIVESNDSGVYLEIRHGKRNLNVMELYPALSVKEIAFVNYPARPAMQ